MDASLPAWIPTLLSGLSVALFTAMLARQAKRDDRIDAIERRVNDLNLAMAKEYFSLDSARDLIGKIDLIIQDLHRQNLSLTRIETELKATRQAALSQHGSQSTN